MKKLFILLTVLAFACKKKTSSPAPADQPQNNQPTGPKTQTITVFAKSHCAYGIIKIDWDASMTESIYQDSAYAFNTNGVTLKRINNADTLRISSAFSMDQNSQYCMNDYIISVNGNIVKDLSSNWGILGINYIKLQ